MKKAIIITIVVGMFGWAIYDFVIKSEKSMVPESSIEDKNDEDENEKEADEPVVGLERGDLAPDFELETLDGDTVRLSDFRGKRVMLNFWATWCPPCRAEMPDMQRFHEDKDVVILAVNLTDTPNESIEKVEDFIDEFGITFRALLDTETAVANLYQIQPIPTNYLIDSEGIIHNKAFGALNYDIMVQEFEKMQ